MICNVILEDYEVREINGVPVLNGPAVVIKMAEMLVDLKSIGIERSNRGMYTRPSKEELTQARELFGMDGNAISHLGGI